ncbi:hypothetical protein [Luteimonas abyssi]|uniref:hypothetical protein n=1 Tax=Luteimonas abyssi TaxID=1247514 RepID=UPI000737AFE1|nr:hypothetical protein [Luteimonas abyssi]
MTSHERAPLDAEERALAALLARHAPEGDPSPALDARILAMAREGDGLRAAAGDTGAPPPPARRGRAARPRRRRWPAMLGVAASLALAVGVAWQLRPPPEREPTVVPSNEQVYALRMPPGADDVATEGAGAAEVRSAADTGEQAAAAASRAPVERAPQAAESPQSAAEPEPASADAPPRPAATGQVAPASISVPEPPPAPPAPPAPGAQSEESLPAASARITPSGASATAAATVEDTEAPAFARTQDGTGNATAIGRRAMAAPAAPASARRAGAPAAPRPVLDAWIARDDDEADDAPDLDEAFDEAPPATADSPEVHRAWLKRIRELRDAGRIDEARESLDELRRRFPDLRVPDDLDALDDPPGR